MRSLFYRLFEDLIRNISGPLGRRIRYWYYKRALGSCGRHVVIDENVFLINPKYIFIEDNVWLDKQTILIAGPVTKKNNLTNKENAGFTGKEGCIYIGRNSHIGIQTIIQGHGGVNIQQYFTSSAGCKIYSLSNDPLKSTQGTVGDQASLHYLLTPVEIEENVWLGLNCCVIGGTLRKNSFVKPNSIVSSEFEENSIIGGYPAKKLHNRF